MSRLSHQLVAKARPSGVEGDPVFALFVPSVEKDAAVTDNGCLGITASDVMDALSD